MRDKFPFRYVFALAALFAMVLLALSIFAGSADAKKRETCVGAHKAINFYRKAANERIEEYNLLRAWEGIRKPELKFSKAKIRSCPYARWIAELWERRAFEQRLANERYMRMLNGMDGYVNENQPILDRIADQKVEVIRAIQYVFPARQHNAAISVASCETGRTWSVWSKNKQYQNIFQMGKKERSDYGWHVAGDPAYVASRAALTMVNATGWYRWQCSTDGGLNW